MSQYPIAQILTAAVICPQLGGEPVINASEQSLLQKDEVILTVTKLWE